MKTPAILTALLLLSAQTPAFASPVDFGPVPKFEEVASKAGISHQYDGEWEFFVGGGVAGFDCNNDNKPEIFLSGGSSPAQLYINQSATGGALKFIKGESGLSATEKTKVIGAYPININNDAYMDLVVLRLGENIILKGDKNCSFTKANKEFGIDGGNAWTTGFSAIWEKGKPFPTLAFGNYIDQSREGAPFGTCHDNILMRPAAGSTTPNYSAATPLSPGYCSLSLMFSDWNGSGTPSLRITNDRQYYRGGQEQMWKIESQKPPSLYSKDEGWKELHIWGMGISQADVNNDGLPEYALSSMGDTMLQSLDTNADHSKPSYSDIAFKFNATAHRPYAGGDIKPSTGWHTQFADINNDGRIDLFIAKGNVAQMPEFALFDPDNLMLGGSDNKFHEQGDKAGIALPTRGRGALVQDFNLDGHLDILVVNREANVNLFRNLGSIEQDKNPLGNWLAIQLDNGAVNPQAIGAKISITANGKTQSQTVQIGGGHASGQSGFSHFGLGKGQTGEIKITWPDGEQSPTFKTSADKAIMIHREDNSVEPIALN